MKTQEIKIQVDSEAANFYQSSSKKKKQKLDALLSAYLSKAERGTRPLKEIMDDASEQARKNGLTPETLEKILNEK